MKAKKTNESTTPPELRSSPVRVRTNVKAGDRYQWYNNEDETSYRGAAAGSDNPSLRN